MKYLNFSESIDIMFTKLLQVKYPVEITQRYQSYIRDLKLKDFLTITEFKFTIDEVVNRITIHKNYTKKEILRITNDTILNGLNEDIHLKFISEGLSDIDLIFRRIMETKKFICIKFNNHSENFKQIENKNIFKIRNKACKFHRVKSHDDNEFITQKKERKFKDSINNVSNYRLHFIYINLNSKSIIKALIDSGVAKSFIKKKLLSEYQVKSLINEGHQIKASRVY
ncbi:hypothetical protein DMUE_1174 [Dictyocoela muelleri]|nr:hypothetical protein DMUE_1174 [Dictyocoela muelleri]